MNWEKLKHQQYYDQPIQHICAHGIFDTNEYDRLYENQNNLDHQFWKQFGEKYKINFAFRESFSDIDFSKDIMCLWFFKERSDGTAAHVQLNGKQITYSANTFLITKSKDILFVHTKRKYIRSPLLQLDMSEETYNDILKRVNKIT